MTPPVDAVCMEDGCTLPPTTTRPISQSWITSSGVILNADEWVCVIHAWSGRGAELVRMILDGD